jgi:hypothetical protein
MIMDDDSTENTPASTLNRRRVLAGTAGLGAAALLGAKLVQAQTATGTPDAGTGTTDTDEQTYYDNFIGKLAANLNISDAATVDTAIRASLTEIVDEELAGGHISQDTATRMKENIASGDVPFLFPGRRGMGRHGGKPGSKNDDNGDATEDDSVDATPTSA